METFVHDGTNAVADGDTAGQVMAQDGAAATPSISFENNTNTGFYRIAANRVGLALNGLNSADFQNAITIFNSGTVKTNNYVLDINDADAGISRVAAGTLAFGNGTAGNSSGSMVANVLAQSPDAGATQHARLQPTGVEIGSVDNYLFFSTPTLPAHRIRAFRARAQQRSVLATGRTETLPVPWKAGPCSLFMGLRPAA